jgi:hypothetical protein
MLTGIPQPFQATFRLQKDGVKIRKNGLEEW